MRLILWGSLIAALRRSVKQQRRTNQFFLTRTNQFSTERGNYRRGWWEVNRSVTRIKLKSIAFFCMLSGVMVRCLSVGFSACASACHLPSVILLCWNRHTHTLNLSWSKNMASLSLARQPLHLHSSLDVVLGATLRLLLFAYIKSSSIMQRLQWFPFHTLGWNQNGFQQHKAPFSFSLTTCLLSTDENYALPEGCSLFNYCNSHKRQPGFPFLFGPLFSSLLSFRSFFFPQPVRTKWSREGVTVFRPLWMPKSNSHTNKNKFQNRMSAWCLLVLA